jgi:hypothetical protein
MHDSACVLHRFGSEGRLHTRKRQSEGRVENTYNTDSYQANTSPPAENSVDTCSTHQNAHLLLAAAQNCIHTHWITVLSSASRRPPDIWLSDIATIASVYVLCGGSKHVSACMRTQIRAVWCGGLGGGEELGSPYTHISDGFPAHRTHYLTTPNTRPHTCSGFHGLSRPRTLNHTHAVDFMV